MVEEEVRRRGKVYLYYQEFPDIKIWVRLRPKQLDKKKRNIGQHSSTKQTHHKCSEVQSGHFYFPLLLCVVK